MGTDWAGYNLLSFRLITKKKLKLIKANKQSSEQCDVNYNI